MCIYVWSIYGIVRVMLYTYTHGSHTRYEILFQFHQIPPLLSPNPVDTGNTKDTPPQPYSLWQSPFSMRGWTPKVWVESSYKILMDFGSIQRVYQYSQVHWENIHIWSSFRHRDVPIRFFEIYTSFVWSWNHSRYLHPILVTLKHLANMKTYHAIGNRYG